MARSAMPVPGGLAVARGGTHYHDHLVGIARHRLGRLRADILLSDAGRGAETHRKVLGRELGGEVRRYQRDDRQLLAVIMHGDAPVWVGAEFEIPKRLPETIQTLAIGRRLGDVVSGTGADDHIIEAIGPGAKGDRLRIEAGLVPARSIVLPMRHRLAGPFRRAWRISVEEWREFGHRGSQHDPGVGDMAFSAGIMGASCFGMAICLYAAAVAAIAAIGGIAREPHIMLAVGAAMMTPAFAWLASGMFISLRADVRSWRQRRNT